MTGPEAGDRPLVIQTEDLDDEAARWLAARVTLVRLGPSDPAFAGAVARAAGLVVRTYTRVDSALLSAAPALRVVARAGVGLDNIDLAACAARGVRVVHTPGANTAAVVEFVVALTVDALRPRVFLERPLGDAEAWQTIRRELTAPRQLADLTLGVIGMGRIGTRVAEVGRSLGMRVLFADLEPRGLTFGRQVSLEQVCESADVISVHVDGRPGNRGLLGPDAFGRMRSDVVFINTSRGFVVDAVACAEFMVGHPSACAMLDVHEPEPIGATSPLLDIPNVHLSPHIAGATASAKAAMSWVVRDLWRVLTGEEPAHAAV
ncbi:MAG: NAD(P)-dependent oxidoreductase [Phycisphaerales bacterium]